MPELPEVETISQDLNHYLIRQIVESVNLIGPETFISPSLLTIKKTSPW
jgi:formamidopyrimidine-DNA glycosylase